MLIAEQRLDLRCRHQLLQELPHHLVIEEPLTVLVPPARSACGRCKGECGGMPDRIIRAQTHKPAKQQVVMELLEQKPLGPNPVERLQQRGQQELLGWYRGPAFCPVQRGEGGVQSIKSLIRQLPDPPQRMTGRDPLLDRHVGE
jgi:hypothetical protein